MGYSSELVAKLTSLVEEGEGLLAEFGEARSIPHMEYVKWSTKIEIFLDKYDPFPEGSSPSALLKHFRYYAEKSRMVRDIGIMHAILEEQPALGLPRPGSQVGNSRCIFHQRAIPLDDRLVFVLMPFRPGWSKKVYSAVRRATKDADVGYALRCERADELLGFDVMQDVYESIVMAKHVVVDTTGHNPNVFLELGMALMNGAPVTFITQDHADKIPFDTNRFRHHCYDLSESGLESLSRFVRGSIEKTLAQSEAMAGGYED